MDRHSGRATLAGAAMGFAGTPNSQLQRTSTRSLVSLASRVRRRVEAAELKVVGRRKQRVVGHSIPVLFAPIETGVTLPKDTPWYDTEDLLAAAIDAGTIWQDTSRNWWHISLTLALAKAWEIEGLSFLENETAILDNVAMASMCGAVDALISNLANGIRVTSLTGDYDYEFVSAQEHLVEIKNAAPNRDNDDEDRSGTEGARFYYSFLRSLQEAARLAQESGRHLVVVQPQP